jgi:hypothetical protein
MATNPSNDTLLRALEPDEDQPLPELLEDDELPCHEDDELLCDELLCDEPENELPPPGRTALHAMPARTASTATTMAKMVKLARREPFMLAARRAAR